MGFLKVTGRLSRRLSGPYIDTQSGTEKVMPYRYTIVSVLQRCTYASRTLGIAGPSPAARTPSTRSV